MFNINNIKSEETWTWRYSYTHLNILNHFLNKQYQCFTLKNLKLHFDDILRKAYYLKIPWFFLNRNSVYFPIVLECTFEIEVTWHRSNTLLTNFKIRIHVCTNWYTLSTNLRIYTNWYESRLRIVIKRSIKQ